MERSHEKTSIGGKRERERLFSATGSLRLGAILGFAIDPLFRNSVLTSEYEIWPLCDYSDSDSIAALYCIVFSTGTSVT